MILVKVYVTLKDSVVDVQGEAVKDAIHSMNYKDVLDVRIGKYFEIKFDDRSNNLKSEIDSICDDLLANPNIESYRYEIVEAN
ncbi:phosphoribosylformylglycinamidine synthase subunit PurS [Companilactobacillus allii]|uniref:Phosphoribosylformylglycinamidine synthase subunit PurS n=1 Tax=Companilactobacillus allii TaxID=1847728 RepID=A0A1P8Q421_9LACO|nr:phosphoribosylformylglycinamidine synthase subunit PurS [Companilactobacillus allii]APX72612.1 phosphoribosylformylglycinamidine synthase [Companilactobacillus allii]USQ69716.1 phosphoribosylformylglycinamidine synthase subunit PurS [Companilactobacillus allii]